MRSHLHTHTKREAAAARATCLWLAAVAVLSASAQAETTATIAPTLNPNRLRALSALTMTVRYNTAGSGVPEPVRRAILHFPAGLSIEVPTLRICSAARLRRLGAPGCPPRSQLGSGHALAEVQAGSQVLSEPIVLTVFLGAPRDLEPTVEVLAQGYSPFDERFVFTGTVVPDNPPYSEALEISLPAIPSIPLEPDASIVELSLTVGARRGHTNVSTAVTIPPSCPLGGFPFAAEFTYADGSTSNTTTTAACPA